MNDPKAIPESRLAADYLTYMSATRAWLNGDPFYPEWQTSGPYDLPDRTRAGPNDPADPVPATRHHPVSSFAIAPTAISLATWYAIPLILIAWVVVSYRPRLWAWPIIAWCAMWTQTMWLVVSGTRPCSGARPPSPLERDLAGPHSGRCCGRRWFPER